MPREGGGAHRPATAQDLEHDPLLAKLAVWGADRDEALQRTRDAVAGFVVEGPKVNLPFFTELLANEEFVSGDYDTGIVSRMR